MYFSDSDSCLPFFKKVQALDDTDNQISSFREYTGLLLQGQGENFLSSTVHWVRYFFLTPIHRTWHFLLLKAGLKLRRILQWDKIYIEITC